MNDHQEHHDDGKVNPFTPEVQEVKESKPDTGPQAKRVNSRLALFGVVGSVALVIFLILMQSAGSQDLKAEREQAAREEEQKRKARNRVDASQANKDAEARMAARQKELDREAREKREAEARAKAQAKVQSTSPDPQMNQGDGQHHTTSQDDQVMVMARGIAAARGEDAQGTRQNGQKNEKDPWEEARKAFVAQDASTYYSNRVAARRAAQFFPSGAPVKPGTSGQQDATSSPQVGVPAPSGQDTPEAFAARLQAGQRQASAPRIASGTGMIQPASSGRASSVGGGSQKGTALASLNTGNAHQEAFYYQGGKAQAGYQPQVQGHGGRVDVQAGTVVHLTLETGLSSELPGVVIARVTRPVYAPSMRRIAIPSGTKVIGTYNARVEKGQTRAQVIWTALVWKDGGTYDLGGLPGVDLGGQSGVEASVDEHWDKAFAGAALAGVLSASASALAGPTNQLQVDPRQQAAYGAMQPFQELGEEKAKEFMAMEPTLTLEPGALAGMLVPHDLVLSP